MTIETSSNETVIVKNNTERVIGYMQPLPKPDDDPAQPRQIFYEPIMLKPGTNEVSKESFDHFARTKTGQYLMTPREGRTSIEAFANANAEQGLKSFTPMQAKDLIENCLEPKTLDNWLDAEKRKEVKDYLKTQIKKVEKLLSPDAAALTAA